MNLPPLLQPCVDFPERVAILENGTPYRYADLLERSGQVAAFLLEGRDTLGGERVGLVSAPGFAHAALLWGIWRAGGCAVPLSITAGPAEQAHILEDAGIRRLLSALPTEQAAGPLPPIDPESAALHLHTSGTTSKPKGVPLTHANLLAQVRSLGEAWAWSPEDRIPLFLPLHHVHGLINILCCALHHGASVEPFSGFDAPGLFRRVRADAFTLFMAVPTVYVKCIEAMEALPQAEREQTGRAFGRLRLMVSGSAALPLRVLHAWSGLTGQVLLERYGMTETGMILSQSLHGERRPGTVGQPLPGVQVRLVDAAGAELTAEGVAGEIQVRGPGVFSGYWRRPEANAESFVEAWFRTGDIACCEDGHYRILGRANVDILKSGGYKLSALEIETYLLDHPDLREVAVVGIPDDTWGEAVCAAVVLREGRSATAGSLRDWCKQRLSPYKVPRHWLLLPELPRNDMGKVNKNRVKALFLAEAEG